MPKKHNKKSSNGKKKKQNQLASVQDLIEAGDSCLENDPDKAVVFYTAALEQETTVDILDKLAQALVFTDQPDEALETFKKALDLYTQQQQQPNSDISPEILERKASFYLNMGQLCTSEEALEKYQQGLELLKNTLDIVALNSNSMDTTNGSSNKFDLQKQISQACCSIAELYLTDLCMQDGAEQACESNLQQALQHVDPIDNEPSIDALQTMASLRLSQIEKRIEATDYILRAYNKIKKGCQTLASLVGLVENDSTTAFELDDSVQSLPPIEFRCNTAKLLLECNDVCKQDSNNTERASMCAHAAISVLGSILAENDEVIEVWSLLGDAFAMLESNDEAIYYWEKAMESLKTIKKNLDNEMVEGDDDEEMQAELDTVECQLDDLKEKLLDVRRNKEPSDN